MNSRRLIASPKSQEAHRSGSELGGESPTDVRFGSLADICGAKSYVRFTPESERKSGQRRTNKINCLGATGHKRPFVHVYAA